ncbi:MAG: CPBP family intramembrane metalloprotease [Candidatus Omnitrophica bacterium]|nr:CPBP family intramembrane metalloprotease [Candidatus Omnitrophota bacterium]
MEPAIAKTPAERRQACVSGVATIAGYGFCVFLLSLLFSFAAAPVVELPFWTVFRRCASIAAALSLWLFIRTLERRSFRSYGFAASGAGKRQFRFGVLLGLSALGLLFGTWLALGVCRVHITADSLKLWRTVVGFLPAAVLVGVLEEMVFRGFILQHLLACSKALAVIASSALYAVVHLKASALSLAVWLELGGLFLFGGVLALSFLLTHQLYLAVGLHAVLAYGARVNKLLIEFTDPSLSWLVGTSRLVNGAASWMVLLMMGGMVVWWVRASHGGGAHHEHA